MTWGYRRRLAVALVALGGAFGERTASAQATTGLWPDLATPAPARGAEGAEAAPSKDAAVIIGIDRYDALPRIPGAADNARDWEKYFLLRRNVPPDRVKLLTDQNATSDAISARLQEAAAQMDPSGTLFVIFIGHGAPADAGKKGILLGADVRPSDSSFSTRGLAYDDVQAIVKTGKQARTVMVLDACFSGVSNEGKTLLAQVQPVVAVNLISTSAMTVFSAGSAAEYAGALPGSMRPALSYLLLGALRGWADTNGDKNVTVAEAQDYASRVLRSVPNNHEQHPQVVTDADDEILERGADERAPSLATIRSQLDTWKAPVEKGPVLPNLRVAVTCDGALPRSIEQGLALYVDGSPTALAAQGGKQTKDASTGKGELQYVSFPIEPGSHRVIVRVPGCREMETDVVVKDGADLDLRGALESDEGKLVRGASGTPNGLRIGLGAWFPTTRFSDGYGIKPEIAAEAQPTYQGVDLRFGGAGAAAHGGFVSRWFAAIGEAGLASMSASVRNPPASTLPAVRSSVEDISMTWVRAVGRVGPRLPLGRAAVLLNLGAGVDGMHVTDQPAGLRVAGRLDGFLTAGALLDVHVTCDLPVFAGMSLDSPFSGAFGDLAASATLGIAYQPNSSCRRENATSYGLKTNQAKVTR